MFIEIISTIFKANNDWGTQGIVPGVSGVKSFVKNTKQNYFARQQRFNKSDTTAINNYVAEVERLKNLQKTTANFNGTIKESTINNKAFEKTMTNAGEGAQDFVHGLQNGTESLDNMTKSSKAAEFGMKALSTAANMALTFLASFVISKAVEKINETGTSIDTVREKTESLVTSLSNMQSSYGENSSKIEELSKKYDELSSGVNEAGINVSLSSSQYDEYKSIIQQLSDIMPDLTTRFNEQGEAIGFVGGKLDDVKKKYKDYQQDQATKILSEGQDGTTYDDVVDNFNNQKDSVGALKSFGIDVVSFFTSDDSKKLQKWSTQKKIDTLQKAIDAYNSSTDYEDAIEKISSLFVGIKNDEYGVVNELLGKNQYKIDSLSPQDLKEFIKGLETKQKTLRTNQDNSANGVKQMMAITAQSRDDYWSDKVGDNGRSYISSVLSGVSYDFLNDNGLNTKEKQQEFVDSLIETIKENKGNNTPNYI